MEVIADYKQVGGGVKERNRFYHALVEIKELAESGLNNKNTKNDLEIFSKIISKCNIINKGNVKFDNIFLNK